MTPIRTVSKIKIMPPLLAAKIAAGEVVERPSSVVKELVENSIDAGAKKISVYIEDGGKRLIRVVDNGCGMTGDEAVMAFKRHATSKLVAEEDLTRISSMGFRGEALPAIASVSRVSLKTGIKGKLTGTFMKMSGSDIHEVSETECIPGCSIEVRDLFFNTPARRKFLRSSMTEFGHIKESIEKISIARPLVRFILSHGRKRVLDLYPSDQLHRINDIINKKKNAVFIHIESDFGLLRVKGYISSPDTVTYASIKGFRIYVNNRWIRDRAINKTIIDGCREIFMDGRFPLVILFLTMPPSDFDINVHPTKNEIRFRLTRDVCRKVHEAIVEGLRLCPPTKPVQWIPEAMEKTTAYSQFGHGGYSRQESLNSPAEDTVNPTLSMNVELSGIKDPYFLRLRVIGQLWDEYLVCESGEDMFLIIDQHAAAERIMYEQLRNEYYGNIEKETQLLLEPEIIDVAPSVAESIENILPDFSKIGFDLAKFGPCSFIVKGVPVPLAGRDCVRILEDLIDETIDAGVSYKLEENIDDLISRIACHSVIRGPRKLSPEETSTFLRELATTDLSRYCPHGRPVIKKISRREIEIIFKRIV